MLEDLGLFPFLDGLLQLLGSQFGVDQGENLIVISRLHKRPDSLGADLDVGDFVALPVHILSHGVEFGPETPPDKRQQSPIFHVREEGVRCERLTVDVNRNGDSELCWQILDKFQQPSHGHLMIVDQTLVNFLADFRRQFVLRLQPLKEHDLGLQISIHLVKGRQNRGQTTRNHREDEHPSHHQAYAINLLESRMTRKITVPNRCHGRDNEIERVEILYSDCLVLHVIGEPAQSIIILVDLTDHDPEAGEEVLDVQDDEEEEQEAFEARTDFQPIMHLLLQFLFVFHQLDKLYHPQKSDSPEDLLYFRRAQE